MRFEECPVPGVWVVGLTPFDDERGRFARAFSEEEFAAQGLETHVSQVNISRNRAAGTIRGMHLQRAPHEEVKMVRCIQGAVFDVAVDARPDSPNYLAWHARELSADNGLLMYVPKGFAHGFQTLTDGATIMYLTSAPYEPAAESGLRWNDPAIGIDWPLPLAAISDKDAAIPLVTRP
jgi:dTDP-4-dehydrorhamnose 3,5-epimerase